MSTKTAPQPDEPHHGSEAQRGLVRVSVHTTSGAYPRHGVDPEPHDVPISFILDKAKAALRLTDVSNWVATVAGREVNPAQTYADNHLAGEVKIQWGPREGGGGC